LEWSSFLKGATLFSIGMVIARLLGMVFSLVLAAVFIPEEFGAVRYAITLGTLVAIFTQPFGQHVLARFIGKHKKNAEFLQGVLCNAGVIQLGVGLVTLLGATVVLSVLGKFSIGILVVFVGVTVFYTYWGISSGYLASGKLTAAYLGSNLVQLFLVTLLIYILKIRSPSLAVMIYGVSYFLPLALLQMYWPFPLRFNISLIKKAIIYELLRFSRPIWISHASYTLKGAIPIIMLEHFSGTADVGVYAVARTLAMIFIFVPSSISTFLMPKTSELPPETHLRLLKKMLLLSSIFNLGLLVGFLLSINWLVQMMLGTEYLAGISVFAIQAIASIAGGIHTVITAVIVGRGSPRYESISRLVALAVTGISAWLLIPPYGPLGAALTACFGTLAGLSAYGIIILTAKSSDPFQKLSRGLSNL
jgi:O-antigen/teichoic acid export membrane protein